MPVANTVWYVAGSNGTADFSNGTALTGFLNISPTSVINGGVYSYRAEHPTDKSIWENGSGAVNTTTGVLARTTIAESSTGSKINFAVPPVVLLTFLKRDYDLLAAPPASAISDSTSVGRSILTAADAAAVATAAGLVRRVRVQVFTSSGTYAPSTGMLYSIEETFGGGGGGGGVAGASTETKVAGGGGAGGHSIKFVSAADVGASQTVTIGAAGTGGSAGANAGAAGGTTSIGSQCIANGGSGGSAGGFSATATSGGTAGTGDIAAPGGNATPAIGDLSPAAGALSMGGTGANSMIGGGGGGGLANASAAAGGAATGKAAGGGGASVHKSATNAAGGNGTAGYAVITEFCTQ